MYIPVGHDWWDLGYWRFGQVFGDDRLARQYLNLSDATLVLGSDDAVPAYTARPHPSGEHYTMRDFNEYPDREIKAVTIEQFKALGDWAFTIATVQDNQAGFDRLARESGARAIYQIGNRSQQVDWRLDPLVLSSSEAEIRGRGVTIHQEYEKDTVFAYRPPPENLHRIGSFVNCFTFISPEYAYWQAAQSDLQEFECRTHGSDGPDGKVVPTTTLADKMASYGFGWHDKPQGDGFGHVIHYLASVGRPLIGHASYYRGLFAGPLWEDGVTCVSIDGRRPHEVAALVREIAADPERHEEMCRAIRARVDELVDFDRDEHAVRTLLGLF